MKLFSRKALAAVATTVALTTAGLTAPAFAEEVPAASSKLFAGSSTDSEDDANDQNGTGGGTEPGSSEGLFDGSSDDDGNVKPSDISGWVGVFTAIIGALSTAFVFFQRITG